MTRTPRLLRHRSIDGGTPAEQATLGAAFAGMPPERPGDEAGAQARREFRALLASLLGLR